MKGIAAEAGLSPELVERAAHLIPSDSGESRLDKLLGERVKRRLDSIFPVSLTGQRTDHLLSVIRATTEQQGTGEANASGLVWRTHTGSILLTAHNEGTESRVSITVDRYPGMVFTAAIGLVLGAAGAVMLTLTLVGLLGPGPADLLIPAALISGGGIGLGIARKIWARGTRRVSDLADVLMDAVRRAMTDVVHEDRSTERTSDNA